jgi:hypothetical protein
MVKVSMGVDDLGYPKFELGRVKQNYFYIACRINDRGLFGFLATNQIRKDREITHLILFDIHPFSSYLNIFKTP